MKTPTAETKKTKQEAKNTKRRKRKLTDLPAKKDVRGGESLSLNYAQIHHEYNP